VRLCERVVVDMSEPKTNRASNIYLTVFSGASVLSAALAWIYHSYFRNDFAALLVFHGADGNCDASTQGLGVHCFGDYSAIHYSNLFKVPQGAEIVYPLVTRVFRLPFLLIESVSNYRVGLACYLVTLLLAILFPVLHAHFTGRIKLALPLWACITCLNIGTLSSLDRGNVIAFAVPFMYLFLIKFQDNYSKSASAYLTLATMVKPQLALLAIVFLWRREIKMMVFFSVSTVLIVTTPYLVFGSKSLTILREWIEETLRWSKSLSPTTNFPTNYSFNRILGVVDINAPKFSFALGFILLAGISLPIVIRRKKIDVFDLIKLSLILICMNSIVYVYYSVLLIPLWVILFTEAPNTSHAGMKLNRGNQFAPVLLALATAPLAWPSRWRIGDAVNTSGAYNMIPVLISLSVILFIVYTTARDFLPQTSGATSNKGF